MIIYEARQNKECVSRRIDAGGTRQRVNIKLRRGENTPYNITLQMTKEIKGNFGTFTSDLVGVLSEGNVGAEMKYLKYTPKISNARKNQEISLVQIVKEEGNESTVRQDNIGFEIKKVKDGEAKGWALDADPIRKLSAKDMDVIKILRDRGDVEGEIKKADFCGSKSKLLFASADYRYSQVRKLNSTPFYKGIKERSETLPEKEHTGWATIFDGKGWLPSYACLRDRPSAPIGALKGMNFKTSAILDGKEYLDTVKWGWSVDESRKVKIDDIEKDSDSGTFFTDVAKRWNSLFVQETTLLERKDGVSKNLMEMPEYSLFSSQKDICPSSH